ncbi:N-acetyltransferase [Angustibacter sp. McL0619]|uniref:N-acetyltransferase n=1 Tax=Angustibacter sp. McL0619 TaxID=3415676 RepID=UPI003CF54CA7
MAWQALTGDRVEVADSPAESRRFGVSVARVTVGSASDPGADGAGQLREVLAEAGQDVLVVRYPADRLALAAVVAGCGRDVLPAGSLTYWGAPSSEVLRPEPDRWRIRSAAALDDGADHRVDHGADHRVEDVVDDVVAASFEGYGNHYLANPLFAPADALAGYQEWARGCVARQPDDVLLLLEQDRVVGLATCEESVGQPSGHLEILLAGLVPAAQGQRGYGHLLAGCADLAGARGLPDTIISTQTHNVRVQRAWARAGLRPFGAVETVHCVRRGLLDG